MGRLDLFRSGIEEDIDLVAVGPLQRKDPPAVRQGEDDHSEHVILVLAPENELRARHFLQEFDQSHGSSSYGTIVPMANSVVIDASAVIAVVTNEVHKPALIRLTEGAELLSPSSLPVEVGNAFSAMFKQRRISLAEAKAAVQEYKRIAIRLTAVDLEKALDLSHQLNIYAYDAYLIACGLQHRSPLLTVDGGLRDAARRVGVEVLEVGP